jgi:hypothetical protein
MSRDKIIPMAAKITASQNVATMFRIRSCSDLISHIWGSTCLHQTRIEALVVWIPMESTA